MTRLLLFFSIFFHGVILGQSIEGRIINQFNQPLQGASVVWLNTKKGVTAGEDGSFRIRKQPSSTVLVISHTGYYNDTIDINHNHDIIVTLREKSKLAVVSVQSQREGTIMSNRSPFKIETLTSIELKKAACCDLAGCFETQTSVQPQTTNVVTNSKELRILGLSGVYNQVLVDGFPMIRASSFTYGISGMPGTLVENIHISKGANSVLQGHESISGQVNVITRAPAPAQKLFLNVYINSFLEKHVNLSTNFKTGKWSGLLAFHAVQPANKFDRDEDKFLDLPLLTRYMVMNKWKLGKENDWGWSSEIAVRFLDEKRTGGQVMYEAGKDKGSNTVYGNAIYFTQPEIWAKTNYRFNDHHRLSLYTSAFHHKQDSWFGSVSYDARQTNSFLNLQYEYTKSPAHTFKAGASLTTLDLNEHIAFSSINPVRTYGGQYMRDEKIAGVFAENMMSFAHDKLTWILGIRADHHSKFGWYATPRTLLKYDVTKQLTVRANIGTGWRTVNLFSENIGLLASSRDIIFIEPLDPERALNTGMNVTQKFEGKNISGHISADFYHTNFQNQFFPDYDSDPTKAFITNFRGRSTSNGFQTDIFIRLYRKYEFKAGYNFLDVYREQNGIKETLPFTAKHKLLGTFSYNPDNNRFHADMNIHWFGQQRLPNTASNPPPYQRPGYSKSYTTLNAQLTYQVKNVELYGGCENIFNFRQKQPILSWQDPFGPYFDISSVWGPTRGREFYLGMRWTLKK